MGSDDGRIGRGDFELGCIILVDLSEFLSLFFRRVVQLMSFLSRFIFNMRIVHLLRLKEIVSARSKFFQQLLLVEKVLILSLDVHFLLFTVVFATVIIYILSIIVCLVIPFLALVESLDFTLLEIQQVIVLSLSISRASSICIVHIRVYLHAFV